MPTLAIAGTFDTKGKEFLYVQKLAQQFGLDTLMIDTGVFPTDITPDVTHHDVATAAGYDIDTIIADNDRAQATAALTKGMQAILPRLYEEGRFDGIISLGGSGGTAIATAGMRELPLGVPKLMVSTMAAGNVSRYVGTSDIVMMPSIVDVAGLNKISCTIYRNAVTAIAGMLLNRHPTADDVSQETPLIAATMFGVTTPAVTTAKERLESLGYEVMVFHATGTGGQTMESLISHGFFAGVLDLTTTEWCDETVGGILAAGPDRCSAAGIAGIPQVVSVGALDMVNYGTPDSVPAEYRERNLYPHNPQVTLMRTSADELRVIAHKIAENLNKTTGPTTMFFPLKGVSMLDQEGGAFWDPEADAVLYETLRAELDPSKIRIVDMDNNINDDAFALACADTLHELITTK